MYQSISWLKMNPQDSILQNSDSTLYIFLQLNLAASIVNGTFILSLFRTHIFFLFVCLLFCLLLRCSRLICDIVSQLLCAKLLQCLLKWSLGSWWQKLSAAVFHLSRNMSPATPFYTRPSRLTPYLLLVPVVMTYPYQPLQLLAKSSPCGGRRWVLAAPAYKLPPFLLVVPSGSVSIVPQWQAQFLSSGYSSKCWCSTHFWVMKYSVSRTACSASVLPNVPLPPPSPWNVSQPLSMSQFVPYSGVLVFYSDDAL